MITLYGFGPHFGLPDASPFVMKTEIQLRMAGLKYRLMQGAVAAAPKHKLPIMEDGGVTIADSTFIRDHIERKYRRDLDRGLTADMRARGWAIERMLEDHLYWAILHLRWADDGNFAKGPARFFDRAPAGAREDARRRVLGTLYGHGLGRHSQAEIEDLGARSIQAFAGLLGHKPFLFGPEPCAADATAFAMIASVMTPFFESELQRFAAGHKTLVSYCERMMEEHYPRFQRKAA